MSLRAHRRGSSIDAGVEERYDYVINGRHRSADDVICLINLSSAVKSGVFGRGDGKVGGGGGRGEEGKGNKFPTAKCRFIFACYEDEEQLELLMMRPLHID